MHPILVTKDLLSAVLFIALGLFTSITSFQTLSLGTQGRMGPGIFPLILGGAMLMLGVLMLVLALRRPSAPIARVHWRSVISVLSAPLIFGLSIGPLGLLPATFLAALIPTFATKPAHLRSGLLIAAGLTAFSFVLFNLILRIPTPLINPRLLAIGGGQ